MELQWRDSRPRRHLGQWRGLRVTVREATRPGLIVNTCEPYWIRLAANGTPLLWVRIEDDYYGYQILRSRQHGPVPVIPPIPFELVEQQSREAGVTARDSAWARLFADGLTRSDVSPLSAGTWHLGYFGPKFDTRELPRALVHQIVKQQSHGRIDWDFGHVYPITLRDMSPPDSGRVKAWRKHARAGSLPPVLLYWVSGLVAHAVLDGHDRLLAASLENVPVSALCLEAAREVQTDQATKDAVLEQVANALATARQLRAKADEERLARAQRLLTTDGANDLLLQVFVPELVPGSTRARPLAGGVNQWASEVSNELAVQGIGETGLLDGLEEKPDEDA